MQARQLKLIFAAAVLSACMLCGCLKRIPPPQAKPGDDTVVIDRKEFLSIARAGTAGSIPVPDSILFKPDAVYPGDQLGITLYEKLPASMEKRVEIQRVDGRGMIFLLPMGTLKVGGLTTYEAERFLEEKLREYYVSPHVELAITEREIGKKQVYLFGASGKQGAYPLKENYRMLDLFAEAGGVSTSILARPVRLIRVHDKQVVMTPINLNDILLRGHLDRNILLQNQDIVYVEKPFLATTGEIFGIISQLLPWYYFALLFGAGK